MNKNSTSSKKTKKNNVTISPYSSHYLKTHFIQKYRLSFLIGQHLSESSYKECTVINNTALSRYVVFMQLTGCSEIIAQSCEFFMESGYLEKARQSEDRVNVCKKVKI